jgi:broad specificity phosphatase PhoE
MPMVKGFLCLFPIFGDPVLVGHDSVDRTLLMQLLDQPPAAYWELAQDPCTLDDVDIDKDRIEVQRINDTSHLPPGS